MQSESALKMTAPHSGTFRRCEDEPIATPGAIQPHGALVILDATAMCVSHASLNVGAMLGVQLADIFAMTAAELGERLGFDAHGAASGATCSLQAKTPAGKILTVQCSTREQQVFLEFEPAAPHDPNVAARVVHFARALRRAETRAQVHQQAVDAIFELTGFDRVAMYVFDTAWHGEVVAEKVRSGCVESLGLRFPSADIPAQARALYAQTVSRGVVDVEYTPVPIACADPHAAPVDLSHCSLRSMSPIHRQYLRNFSAKASFSLSLVPGERLYGLISCNHEQGPQWISPERRHACAGIAEIVSGMLEREFAAKPDEAVQLVPALVRKMARLVDMAQVLSGDPPNMLGVARADGAALYHNGNLTTCGAAPPPERIKALIGWLEGRLQDGIFVTDSLPGVFADAEAFREQACGLLAVAPSTDPFTLLLWFRREIPRQVAWGGRHAPGDPDDPATLQPRQSFERWQQAVHLHAEPFSDHEVANGKRLAQEVAQGIVRQSMRLARDNADLERSNRELDAFAHAASHDLKEPLRGVNNFVASARRDLADGKASGSIAKRLEGVTKLTDRMNGLIGALMHYAEVGGSRLDMRPTPLRRLIEPLLETLRKQPDEKQVTFELPDALPTVLADQTLLGEVFTNLFTNAIKYNEGSDVRIVVGEAEAQAPDMVTLFVRDNGIGVAQEHHEDIFGIFRRLHGREKFGGGSGTGLTIAKRIVESHGGAMWLESAPGKGSTFYFSMRRAAAEN